VGGARLFDVSVQTVGTLLGAGLVALVASVSGTIGYDARSPAGLLG
jgi:hypothetical protein